MVVTFHVKWLLEPDVESRSTARKNVIAPTSPYTGGNVRRFRWRMTSGARRDGSADNKDFLGTPIEVDPPPAAPIAREADHPAYERHQSAGEHEPDAEVVGECQRERAPHRDVRSASAAG